METARKDKRIYTKRTPEARKQRLQQRLEVLKAAHATRAQLIEKLSTKLYAIENPSLRG